MTASVLRSRGGLLAGSYRSGVKVVDYGIRGMHLAYDLLDGYDGLVIVDALPRHGTPGDVVVLQVRPEDLGDGDFDAHGMEPVAVLASLGSMGGELPPTYIVGCEPADLDEGIGLTPAVEASIERGHRRRASQCSTGELALYPSAELHQLQHPHR